MNTVKKEKKKTSLTSPWTLGLSQYESAINSKAEISGTTVGTLISYWNVVPMFGSQSGK